MPRNKLKRHFFIVIVIIATSFGLAIAETVGRYLEESYDSNETCDPHPGVIDDQGYTFLTGGWITELDNAGFATYTVKNSNFKRYSLTDPDLYDWGRDYLHIETRDIVLVAGHGNSTNRDGTRYYRLRHDEPYSGGCLTWPDDQMRLGEDLDADDIEILHMVSCHSMTWDDSSIQNTWRPVFNGLQLVTGFHGNSYSGSDLYDDYQNLGADGLDGAVALEWLAELWEPDFTDDHFDQCPIAYAGRKSEAAVIWLLEHLSYDEVEFFQDIEEPTYFKRLWISGCQPSGNVQQLP